MTQERINELEKKFLNELVVCTKEEVPEINKMLPHEIFQWFVDNFKEDVKCKRERRELSQYEANKSCPQCRGKVFIGKHESWCETYGCSYNITY